MTPNFNIVRRDSPVQSAVNVDMAYAAEFDVIWVMSLRSGLMLFPNGHDVLDILDGRPGTSALNRGGEVRLSSSLPSKGCRSSPMARLRNPIGVCSVKGSE